MLHFLNIISILFIMKKILCILFFLFLPFSILDAFTLEEIQQHNNLSDCWMVFEGKVYDLTRYISEHVRYMDIEEWCGQDMTEDFKNKAGLGRDHKNSSYTLLDRYYIGDIGESNVDDIELHEIDDNSIETVVRPKEYSLIFPFLISLVAYWGSYFLIKRYKILGINIVKFNAFWNTILFLTLLVPALGFGIFMVIRTKKPELWDLEFDFTYWHVELSLVMGVLGINHFIQRLGIYLKQLKK